MPSHMDCMLAEAEMDDPFTDADLADLKQEIVRDVTQTLMFCAVPGPAGGMPTVHEEAAVSLDTLSTLSTQVLHHPDAAGRLSRLASRGPDNADGALHFACLLRLAGCYEGAQFWWQFSAGAGNAVAAQCLNLYHLSRGEVRDAGFWAEQALTLADPPTLRAPRARQPDTGPRETRLPKRLQDAVRRLKVDTVEDFGMGRVPRPDSRLEELTDVL
ncbi:hypothetical protein GCM10010277_61090 [Streptomyces longisporoflavus]|uniref:hypothetical protein n=1 Tax=Streptomyces longisporoflavus TaxID=28044 RepID=UPI00167CC8CD|nr:hypothetical protein [Streptomyces longisporoflavus]GGV58418.1 hypothetical protein GCM10010277_61090 [Streptomyces longisporoflavus]